MPYSVQCADDDHGDPVLRAAVPVDACVPPDVGVLKVCYCPQMTTMEIPFSVPPYMSLLARSVATLEGIALMGDPDYQMVAQACAPSPNLPLYHCLYQCQSMQ